MANFSKYRSKSVASKKVNPCEIYKDLDRKSEAGPLRPIQENILNTWFTQRRSNKDVIVKLHTGAGKTLIGLLMGLSYINNGEGPVAYVCPNIYLMQQVCADAQKFGVPFCIFKTGQYDLPEDFLSGKKILITYVQKMFNGLSVFGIGGRSCTAGCIILDDSHACMDSILAACTINIEKKLNTKLYDSIFCLFTDEISQQGEGTYQDILDDSNDEPNAIPYWAWYDKRNEITRLLSDSKEDKSVKFAWPLIKDQIGICRAFISSKKIEISPECIPIKSFGIFNNADHRILMSATTQEDTLFIKGMGLSIEGISNPLIDPNYLWSGEKMIIIPSMVCRSTSVEKIEELLLTSSHPKYGLAILVPSFEKAKKYTSKNAILANGPDSNMYPLMQEFKQPTEKYIKAHSRNIIFANRYDGIDLPDETCRILILDSLPHLDSLADTYEELCRVNSDIVKIKISQKIEQGLGRSVRGEKDYSVVIILGNDLIKYLRTASNRIYFSAQTQKQIDIGFEIVNMDQEEQGDELHVIMDTINQCINRDEDWKDYYVEKMDEIEVKGTDKTSVYNILQKERQAYEYALANDFNQSCESIQAIVDSVSCPEEKAWYTQLLAKYKYSIARQTSVALQRNAFMCNNELLKPISDIAYTKVHYAVSEKRTDIIKRSLCSFGSYIDFSLALQEVLGRLAFGTSANNFERAMNEVGQFLGYTCQRPDKTYRKGPDNLWCDETGMYYLIECKSEVSVKRQEIHKSEAGQVEQHCAWFHEEYKGKRYSSFIIIPTNKLANDAYFGNETCVMTQTELMKFITNIREFFAEFEKYRIEDISAETITKWLSLHHLESGKLIMQYTIKPVRLFGSEK